MLTQKDSKYIIYDRTGFNGTWCPFHQYFWAAFLYKNVLHSFFVLTVWVCNFLTKGKLLVKCWWHWLLVYFKPILFVIFPSDILKIIKSIDGLELTIQIQKRINRFERSFGLSLDPGCLRCTSAISHFRFGLSNQVDFRLT